jgi:hypothetical protein
MGRGSYQELIVQTPWLAMATGRGCGGAGYQWGLPQGVDCPGILSELNHRAFMSSPMGFVND